MAVCIQKLTLTHFKISNVIDLSLSTNYHSTPTLQKIRFCYFLHACVCVRLCVIAIMTVVISSTSPVTKQYGNSLSSGLRAHITAQVLDKSKAKD